MARGFPMPELVLTTDERDTLGRWARRPTTAQALAKRARMILACAEGRPNEHVARLERVTPQTVGRARARFVTKRLDGLLDEPRPGAPRKITDEQVERVVQWTLETKPRDATHRSTRAMAARSGLSHSVVSRIWRAFALQPLGRRSPPRVAGAPALQVGPLPPRTALPLVRAQWQGPIGIYPEAERKDYIAVHEDAGEPDHVSPREFVANTKD
jgi:transposase